MNANLFLVSLVIYGGEIFMRYSVYAGSCYDMREDCKNLKTYGWCERRASIMKSVCGKTCSLCGVKVLQKRPTYESRAKIIMNECKNHRDDCSMLQDAGWCNSRRSLMSKLCGPTCGLCEEGKENLVHVTVATKTTTTKVRTSGSQCVDLRSDCHRLGNEFGWCISKREAMVKLCAATCNACSNKIEAKNEKKKEITAAPPTNVKPTPTVGVCYDRMKGCNFMLTRGWCNHRKAQMEGRCRKTCGFCDPCSDTRTDCFKSKANGWCETKKDAMAKVCARTCDLCNKVTTNAKVKGKNCKDTHKDCAKMKNLGFCDSRTAAMKKICPQTCEMCSPSNPNTIVAKLTTVKPKTTKKPRVPGCKDAYGRERCEYYAHIGWCTKHEKIRKNCHDTCVCNPPTTVPPPIQACPDSSQGCCWDKKTTKRDAQGSNCPGCADDQRFSVLCGRFGGDCTGSGSLAKSLHKYCPKTCKLC